MLMLLMLIVDEFCLLVLLAKLAVHMRLYIVLQLEFLIVILVVLNEENRIGLLHLANVGELCLVDGGVSGLNCLVMHQVWTLPFLAIHSVDIFTTEGDQLFQE